MNDPIQFRAAKVLREIDEHFMHHDRATPGPWYHNKYRATIQTRPIDGHASAANTIIALVPSGSLPYPECKPEDAAFISASRTGWPVALRCLRTAIEGLIKVTKWQYENSLYAEAALVALCDQWDAARKEQP